MTGSWSLSTNGSAPPERHAKLGVQRLCKHSPGTAEKGPQRLRSFFTTPLCPSHFLMLLVAALDVVPTEQAK
jgi:hypothetical protein